MFKKRKYGFVLFMAVMALLMGAVFTNELRLVKPDTALASETAAANRYTVKSGDTLYLIAKRYGATVDGLKKANGLTGDLIMPGQVLTIPSGAGNVNRYTVKSGDSLYLIATRYGITVDALKKANGLSGTLIMPGQVLVIPGGNTGSNSNKPAGGMSIIVDKSEHTLTLYANGAWLKSYHVEFGDGGAGAKQVSGDHKTPEGRFYITEKSVLSPADEYLGTRWMRLSYPNINDANRGLRTGLIDQSTHDQIVTAINQGITPPQRTALGGGVGIHGGSIPSFGSDWTWGCVGLTNKDAEDLYNRVQVGTPVIIQK